MNQTFYISNSDFDQFLEVLSLSYQVYVPVKKDKQRFYKKFTSRRTGLSSEKSAPLSP